MAENKEESYAWAVKTGDLNNVKEFVEKDKMSVNLEQSNKRTPLHWAADFNQVKVMEYLLSKGAKINAKDNYGITPLLAAVYENHFDAVKFLLEKGADASVKGPDGNTAANSDTKAEIKALFKK
eukprot:TRINITY_DN235_c0_g1_i1.p1 TRINITY_DN235_c0_g1~~TRINITY_DN235_c0_g1_i1.p1  ORF type:complete len:124 (+),score=43.35 TRINITY_DN235_c0_g1_i1:88-459(+)